MWLYLITAISLSLLGWLKFRRPSESSPVSSRTLIEEDMDRKSSDDLEAQPDFDNLLNFRDVGKSVNFLTGKKLVAENRLFRSARLDDITLADRRKLRLNYGIQTIIDLRTKTEHIMAEKKRQARLQDPSFPAFPVKIPGIKYIEVNVNGKNFEVNMLWKLSLWSFLKLIVLMVSGYRLQGISILVKEVMQPRGLHGLGYDTLDFCGSELASILTTLSSPTTYPVLIHCTQGKDRTGAIIALLLLLLEIPITAITDDYCLSERELLSERESRLREMREIGFSDDFAGCPGDWIESFDGYLRERYGGVKSYLEGIGVGVEMQRRIIEVLGG